MSLKDLVFQSNTPSVKKKLAMLVSILTDFFFLQENAHFYVADMIISAMEKMKCNILSRQHTENWRTEEVSRALGNDQAYSEVNFHTNVKQESGSSTSSDSGYEGKWGKHEKILCCVLQTSLFLSNHRERL